MIGSFSRLLYIFLKKIDLSAVVASAGRVCLGNSLAFVKVSPEPGPWEHGWAESKGAASLMPSSTALPVRLLGTRAQIDIKLL